jgi:protocatechuate 3,4-dioxygenase beta subunit
MPRGTRREFFAPLLTFGMTAASISFSMLSGTRVLALQAGLDKFLVPAPPCKDDLTPTVPPDSAYRPGAPVRKTLIDKDTPGTKMTLSGYVTGLTCGRIKGARLDFWQADANGKIDNARFGLRGAVLTDTEGRYTIETIVPGSEGGRARHLNVRIGKAGKKPLTTLLFFPDDVLATKDRQFNKSLVMKTAPASANAYTFDFLLDA